jgi:hypothetical protein
MTQNPITFGCDADQDAVKEVAASLRMALDDVTKRPIFDEPAEDEWSGKGPT